MGLRYPHMYAAESDIWDRWLKIHKKDYMKFEYDVHVGRLWPEHEELSEEWRKGAAALYQKRIDVVGHRPGEVTLFEVKVHAGLGALGQIVGYLELYEEQFAPGEDLRGAIITELVDPNIKRILEQHGIDLYVMPRG